jgi:PAS domain S-box-containing protein
MISGQPRQPFLPAEGDLADLIAAYNWSGTSLGPIEGWPDSVKTSVGFLLRSTVPMVSLWGEDGVMIYNDAYSQFAGGRHPQLLGSRVREGWPEVADFNDNVMKVVLDGGTLSYKDQELVLHRRGVGEPAWMNLEYSPVIDEEGRNIGVLAIVLETTERVLADRRAAVVQERQHQMLRQMPGFVGMLTGPDFVYEYVNDAYVKISERSDFIGRRFKEVFPDIADQGFFELLDRAYRTGEGIVMRDMELRLHGSQDSQFIDFVFEPIRDSTGDVDGIFIGGYETTETRRAVLALQASEARLRDLNADLERQVIERTQSRGKIWQLSPDLLGALNPHGYFETSNPAWLSVLGWTEDEVASMPIWELLYPEDVERTRAGFSLALDGEPTIRFMNRFRCKDGGYRWISWVGIPEDNLIYCSGRDVTVEKTAEAERDQLWALSEDILARGSYAGGLSAVNPAWNRIMGWSEAELLVMPYADLIHADDLPSTLAALAHMGETRLPARYENRVRTKDGAWKSIGWVVSPEADGVNFIAVGRDLSEDKARERELAHAQDALRQAQKMEAVGQLTGGLAHDFNNIIAGISGSLQMMQTRIAQGRIADVDRYVNGALGASKRAAGLTQRLLAFSRRQTLDPQPTDLNRLVAGMEELISRSVGPEVHVEAAAAGGLWTTFVDPGQLENALLNLCINARDAMPHGGKLTIETANRWLDERAAQVRGLLPGQYVSLCVSDTGTGMSEDVAIRAFDPFFTTKPIGQGTGLGLSMVYGFAGQSGGSARIYSEVGKGTMVCIYIPRYLGEAEDVGPDAVRDEDMPRSDHNETIMVVDDEPLVRMIVVEQLLELGYAVLEAEDAPSALRVLTTDRTISLLVTDVGLPGGMNGRQLADAAREKRPDMQVLFITGYAENAVLNHGHLDHGMHVMTKPFAVEDFARRIDSLIGNR